MLGSGQESQVPGKKQIILNFVERSQGVQKESPKIGIGATPRPFSDIGWD